MEPAEWIEKNTTLKEGVSIEDFKGLVNDLNPLKNITTPDQALEFMGRNEVFGKALHKHETIKIEKHDEKFRAEKLPSILEEAKNNLRKELNPEETADQKELREMREKMNARDQKDFDNDLKGALRKKASELKADPLWAEKYSAFGEKAEEMMVADLDSMNARIAAAVEATKQEIYGNNPPPPSGKKEVPKDIDTQIYEAKKAGNGPLALRLQLLKNNQKP